MKYFLKAKVFEFLRHDTARNMTTTDLKCDPAQSYYSPTFYKALLSSRFSITSKN